MGRKIFNELKDHEKSKYEVLIEKAVKIIIQIQFGKRIFGRYDNAAELKKENLLIEVNERPRR